MSDQFLGVCVFVCVCVIIVFLQSYLFSVTLLPPAAHNLLTQCVCVRVSSLCVHGVEGGGL